MTEDRALVDEIKSKLDLVQIISETIKLKQVGNAYRGATSATSKSGSSLIVDPKKQIYNNTATEDGGDVFNWIAYAEGLDLDDDFPKIIEIAAEKAGVQLPTHDPVQANEKAELNPFMKVVAGFYHSNLTDEHRYYIHEKWGISDEMIDGLMIGWAPKDDSMQREMRELFDIDTIQRAGLVYVNENKLVDIFKGRIIFPYWKGDNVVYFIGRDPDPKSQRKYFKQLVHSEERPYISKCIDNSYFYGENSIRRADSVIITEGVTDCIKALQEGLACISPVTVRIKESQKEYAYQLVKNKSEVRICNDNEENEAGKNGAIATAEYLESRGVQVRVVELPRPDGVDKIDLADYLKVHTKEDFEQLESDNVWETKLRAQTVPSKTVEKVRVLIRFISNDLKSMDSILKKPFIENEVAEYFGLSKPEISSILKSIKLKEDTPNIDNGSFFTERGKLKVKGLAEHLMDLDHFITFEDTKKIFCYRNGVYVPHGEDIIAKNVQNALGDESKRNHIAEIINYIQLETLLPRSRINHDTGSINLLNGIYNLETGELEEHNPDNISIVQIPVKYDPDAKCPKIEQFMKDVLKPEDIQVIYEFIGYCLIPDARIEKSVMLLGKGANGKSVMLSMLGEFLGDHNTSCESLHMLEKDPYSLAELYGKLANVFPDLASSVLYEHNIFKMLTGNEVKPLPTFSYSLNELRDALQPFLDTLNQEAAHTEIMNDLDEKLPFFNEDVEAFKKSIEKEQASWKKQETSIGELRKAVERLTPLVEASRDLVKEADLLYKLAYHLINICETECGAHESDMWRGRDITRFRKAADEARAQVVEQLKQVRYFWKQAHWLTKRFPEAKLGDVEGLVKLVDRAELEANDWSLTPSRYVGVAPEEEGEDFDFEESIRDIHVELEDLNAEAARLAATIKKNFEDLGI